MHQELAALCGTVCLAYFRLNASFHLFHALDNCCGNSTGVCETLAVYGRLLIAGIAWLQFYALGTHDGTHLTVCQYIICIALNLLIDNFRLLCYTWSDKYSHSIRILCFDHTGYRTHWRDGCGNLICHLREVQTHHIDKSRTAGSYFLLSCLVCLYPLCGFGSSGHIST